MSALSRIICHRNDGDSLPRTLVPLALTISCILANPAVAAWDCRPSADGRSWQCTGGSDRAGTAADAAAASPKTVTPPEMMSPEEPPADRPEGATAAPAPTAAAPAAAPTSAKPTSAKPTAAKPTAAELDTAAPFDEEPTHVVPIGIDAERSTARPAAAGDTAAPGAGVPSAPAAPAITTDAPARANTEPVDIEPTGIDPASAGAGQAVIDIDPDFDTDMDAGIDWASCALPAAPSDAPSDIPTREEAARLPVIVDADSMVAATANEVVEFAGDVNVVHGDLSMRADNLKLNRLTREVEASGSVTAIRPDLRIGGSAAQYRLDSRTGRLDDVEYRVPAMRARGTAQSAELLADGQSRYQDISYTTCRPGNSDWLLTASSLELDRAEGIGTADEAKLTFKGVPILYVPTMTYPIDDRRRSGFLLPSIGYSDNNGLDLGVPYYFNLSENYDFTFAPRLLTKRGLLLGGEFRYLTESSEGELAAELLPDDAEFNGSEQIRGAVSLLHHTQFTDHASGHVRYGRVSDRDYLSDLGNNLAATSKTHIEQTGEVLYRTDTWSLVGRVQQHQTIDEAISRADRPYARLPQVRLDLLDDRGIGGTTYHLQAEYVNFHRDDSVRGHRIDLFPAISLPLRNSWGYVIPKAGGRYTAYDLTDQVAGQDSSPSSGSAMFSLDSGMVFERTAGYFGTDSVHTLEPRIFYLHVPHSDQDDQPIFDTAEQDFSFDRLFRENRFSGADRFGDANQLTLALTSRYLSTQSGEELLRASIGQILYFDDLEVTLPGQAAETDGSSPVVAELSGRIAAGWRATAGIEWDPHAGGDGNIDQALAQVSYRGPEGRAFNAAYRMRDNEIEQTDIAGVWPVSETLSVVGRYNHSLRDDRLLEAVAGFEYRSCCWRFRSLLQSHTSGTDDDQNLGVLFQLELNGLGRLGNDIESVLERSIYAYR